jgi:D-sedoheptulose 7-phosphate isomerase
MMTNNIINNSFDEHLEVVKLVREKMSVQIYEAAKLLAKSLQNGGTLFWCGNGGSAADSQHMAAELVGRFKNNRKALRSIALTTDSSVLTCVSNDYSYDDVFSRQVESLGRFSDVLIGISTSGNSENVNRAFKTAKSTGLKTIALLGKAGGEAKGLVDIPLIVPSNSTARIQESHILIGHVFCELIELEMGFA